MRSSSLGSPALRLRRLTLAMLVLVPLAGCSGGLLSYPPQVRGNKVDADVVAQLVIGTSTRQDATALLGSPTIKAPFDDNSWIYISEVTKPVIAGTQAIEDQQAYVLTFDQKGVLVAVQKRTQQDAQTVDVVARTTPSPGTEATWMQQLLGNVGRFSTNPVGISNQGQQGTSTNPGNF